MSHTLKVSSTTLANIHKLLCGPAAWVAKTWTADAGNYLRESVKWTVENAQTAYADVPTPLTPVELQANKPLAGQVHPIALAAALLDTGMVQLLDGLFVYEDAWHPLTHCEVMAIDPPRPEGFRADLAVAEPGPTPGVAKEAVLQGELMPRSDGKLPSQDITAESKGPTGRPRKSPFSDAISPTVPKAKHPSWWNATLEVAPGVLTSTAQDLVGAGAGVDLRCKAYVTAISLLSQQLTGVNGETTVEELRAWLKGLSRELDSCPAAPQLQPFTHYAFQKTLD